MRFGVVLPTWVYTPKRAQLAEATFASLMKTEPPPDTEVLVLVRTSDQPNPFIRESSALNKYLAQYNSNLFTVVNPTAQGTEMSLAYGSSLLFDSTEVDYTVWMGDDALFNPHWLQRLQELIERHPYPDAKCWSVYRSNHTFHHATLEERGLDTLVRSICGHGMTISRKEWYEWGKDWRTPEHLIPNTYDLQHPLDRPGERWVTRVSYVAHTGEEGIHCRPGIPEYAQNLMLEGVDVLA